MKQISQDTHTAKTCFFFRLVKAVFYEEEKLSKMLFLTRDNEIQVVKPSCKFLFLIWRS